jgi:hypothetical protein
MTLLECLVCFYKVILKKFHCADSLTLELFLGSTPGLLDFWNLNACHSLYSDESKFAFDTPLALL